MSLERLISANNPKIESQLKQLIDEHGLDKLKDMNNSDFYRLYKNSFVNGDVKLKYE